MPSYVLRQGWSASATMAQRVVRTAAMTTTQRITRITAVPSTAQRVIRVTTVPSTAQRIIRITAVPSTTKRVAGINPRRIPTTTSTVAASTITTSTVAATTNTTTPRINEGVTTHDYHCQSGCRDIHDRANLLCHGLFQGLSERNPLHALCGHTWK